MSTFDGGRIGFLKCRVREYEMKENRKLVDHGICSFDGQRSHYALGSVATRQQPYANEWLLIRDHGTEKYGRLTAFGGIGRRLKLGWHRTSRATPVAKRHDDSPRVLGTFRLSFGVGYSERSCTSEQGLGRTRKGFIRVFCFTKAHFLCVVLPSRFREHVHLEDNANGGHFIVY